MPEANGHEVILGSDVQRDGMYLELSDGRDNAIAEVFYSDADGSMVINTFGNGLPLATAEWLIAEAKRRLPPRDDRAEIP